MEAVSGWSGGAAAAMEGANQSASCGATPARGLFI